MIDFSSNNILIGCSEKVSDQLIYVKDFFGGTSEISDESEAHVIVNNSNSKEVTFLKIDKCVFGDGDRVKKSDFGLFTVNHSYFVEIKEIQSDSHDSRKKKRKEATLQLIETINSFKQQFGLTDLKKTTAVIALIPTFESDYRKIISSREQGVINEFMTKCGCPNIKEGNYIEV
jgi:hypothetical protein